ncbi:MAG: hypothetical protein KF901_02245 [Myxococcales bacterium]|nr:hypothetical protein [Myxococcales bacterium]
MSALDPAAIAAEVARLGDDPSDDALLVFSDWLQTHGHPWGELIALQHAAELGDGSVGDRAPTRGELRAKERAALPALLGEALLGVVDPVSWRSGFLQRAVVSSERGERAREAAPRARHDHERALAERVEAILSRPVARRLEALVLDALPERFLVHDVADDNHLYPWPAAIRALERAPRTLKELAFGHGTPVAASAYVRFPDLHALAEVLPDLERLHVQGSSIGRPPRFAFPRLRELAVLDAETTPADLDALVAAELPQLERLVLSLGGLAYCAVEDVELDGEVDDPATGYDAEALDPIRGLANNPRLAPRHVRAFLAADWPPSLVHLGLRNAELGEEMLRVVAGGRLIGSLRTLDLSDGTLRDDAVATLVQLAPRLRHLERLDLRGNLLGPEAAQVVATQLPNADVAAQRDDSLPAYVYRYVAVME